MENSKECPRLYSYFIVIFRTLWKKGSNIRGLSKAYTHYDMYDSVVCVYHIKYRNGEVADLGETGGAVRIRAKEDAKAQASSALFSTGSNEYGGHRSLT